MAIRRILPRMSHDWLTLETVAEDLGVGQEAVRAYVRQGRLLGAMTKIEGRWRVVVLRSSLRDFRYASKPYQGPKRKVWRRREGARS